MLAVALPDADVPDMQPLDAVARLIAGASLVVGVDTGLLHLASALTVPLAAIFVGSEPALTAPVGRGPMAVIGGKGQMPSAAAVIAEIERLL
jgi:heptosyltransferase-1